MQCFTLVAVEAGYARLRKIYYENRFDFYLVFMMVGVIKRKKLFH